MTTYLQSSEDLTKDIFVAAIASGEVNLRMKSEGSKVIFRVLKKEQSVQQISSIEKRIQVVFSVEMILLEPLLQLQKLKIEETLS